MASGEATDRMTRIENAHAKRAERRPGRVTVVPLLLLETVNRSSVATYVALSDFANSPFGAENTNSAYTPHVETELDTLAVADRARVEALLIEDVHICWPGAETLARLIPSTQPDRRTPKKAIWPWLDDLERAGWIKRFNRRDNTNIYLIAKKHPWPAGSHDVPTPWSPDGTTKKDHLEEGISSFGTDGELIADSFADTLLDTSADLGPDRYPPQEIEF